MVIAKTNIQLFLHVRVFLYSARIVQYVVLVQYMCCKTTHVTKTDLHYFCKQNRYPGY